MNLVARAKAIILTPKTEWVVIEQEQTTVQELYRSYIIPLAAIAPIATIIGYSVFGVNLGVFGAYRVPLGRSISAGVTHFVLSLVTVYVGGLIINALAPKFGGVADQMQAFKLSAYGSTAGWLAGIFALLPGLRTLAILGLYSLYLLFLGVPVMMKSPDDRTPGYVAAVVGVWIVLMIAVQAVTRNLAY